MAESGSAIRAGEADRMIVIGHDAQIDPENILNFHRHGLLPFRRRLVLENLRRVFGETLPESEICRLAQAYYAHFARFLIEFIRLPWMSDAKRKSWIRVENMESPTRAHEQGKGVLLLTGHIGNWEVATVAAISEFPQFKGLFHFLRRPLKPRLLNEFVTWRFKRAGFGTLAKRGSLEAIFDLLAAGAIVVYVFDQHSVGHLQKHGHSRHEYRSSGRAHVELARTRRNPCGALRRSGPDHRV